MKHIFATALLLLAQPVFAAMSLDKIILYLNDQPNSREDIVVTNPDAETLYLQTEIYRVDNPGMPDEKRVRVVDPKEFRLLVSPSKAVIPAGEQKRFRLMSLEQGLDKERVYRVTFKPVVGDLKTDKTALKILVAYQALIFVQPKSGSFHLQLEKTAPDALAIVNNGNINAEISGLQYCQRQDQCAPLEQKGRIYSGAKLQLEGDFAAGGYIELVAKGARESEKIRLAL
ncbi:fimbrial biogenesis chaperone [Microbulbifer pacificus]|uniref:Fimbria/pilus periplasmic chaperone n=1 Tax=Microbulbifer pacificus TaxID=407164 RepID=A0AAU0MXH4_9GAMM|nr:fimbria/pilus periplasmic chaperone [Microbulbifer pacificus]WOX04818.1 fimbria/pilus periplasmic chaperone [Microbulbifer pacificus]